MNRAFTFYALVGEGQSLGVHFSRMWHPKFVDNWLAREPGTDYWSVLERLQARSRLPKPLGTAERLN